MLSVERERHSGSSLPASSSEPGVVSGEDCHVLSLIENFRDLGTIGMAEKPARSQNHCYYGQVPLHLTVHNYYIIVS